jgi:hypothetical protein
VRGSIRKHASRKNPSSGASRHLLPQGEKEEETRNSTHGNQV